MGNNPNDIEDILYTQERLLDLHEKRGGNRDLVTKLLKHGVKDIHYQCKHTDTVVIRLPKLGYLFHTFSSPFRGKEILKKAIARGIERGYAEETLIDMQTYLDNFKAKYKRMRATLDRILREKGDKHPNVYFQQRRKHLQKLLNGGD
jgi:hypothetical protein